MEEMQNMQAGSPVEHISAIIASLAKVESEQASPNVKKMATNMKSNMQALLNDIQAKKVRPSDAEFKLGYLRKLVVGNVSGLDPEVKQAFTQLGKTDQNLNPEAILNTLNILDPQG